MPRISMDEAFGEPSPAPSRKRVSLSEALPTDTAEHVQDALTAQEATSLVSRSLEHAGFGDVDVTQGLDPETRQLFEDRQAGVEGQLREDKEIKEAAQQLATTRELRTTAGFLFSQTQSIDELPFTLEDVPRPLRPFLVGTGQIGLRTQSALARVIGADETADQFVREGRKLSEFRASMGTSKIEDIIEGVVTTVGEGLIGSALGLGPVGLALAAGARVGNASITDGRDAGLEGLELASFAAGQAVIETGLTLAFGKVLGPGFEAIGQPLKEGAKTGLKETLKRFGIATLAELPEEVSIELLSAYASAIQGVGPELTAEMARDIMIDTTLAVILTVGASTGVRTGQAALRNREQASVSPEAETETQPAVTPTAETQAPPSDSILVTKKRLAQLKDAATKDKLTGLGNRALDERAVETTFKRADRTKTPTAIVSFDVANFKTVNDTQGLQVGDRVLQVAADAIDAETRGEGKGRGKDVAGIATRPGGDEFNVILPSTDKKGGEALAKRIQDRFDKALKAEGLDLPAEGRPVFIAPGVVQREPGDTRSIEDLRNEADFAVKAEKKRVKTELGVPLTREEAAIGTETAPAQPTPVAKAPETAAPGPQRAPTTPSQIKAEVAATGTKVTPSSLKAKKPARKTAVKRKKTIAQELKAARKGTEGEKKGKFTPEGFRGVARFARPRLTALKSTFAKETQLTDQSRNELLSLARTVLPPAERGKLIPAIAKLQTGRQAETMRGRIANAVETFSAKIERDRLKGEQKKLRKLGIKIPQEVKALFPGDTLTNLRVVRPTDLTAEEAEARANQIAQLRGLVKELNDLKLGTEKKDLKGLAADMVGEMKKSAPVERAETGRAGIISRFFNEANTKPEELLARMGSQIEQALHFAMKRGESKTMRINRSYSETMAKQFDMKELATWSRQVAGRKVKFMRLKLESGKELELTFMEAAHLLAASRTIANRAAVLKDGITLRRKMNESKIAITEDDLTLLDKAAKKENPDIGRFADAVKTYLNKDIKPQYEQAFVDLNNYSNTIDDYLFLQRNRQDFLAIPKETDFQALNNFTLEQLRETKQRTNSGASVLIDDLSSLTDNHVRRVGLFIGMARPIRNANLVLSHPDVAREMDSRFGTQRRAFLTQRMDNAVQAAIGYKPGGQIAFFNEVFSKLIDNATKGVLGANPAVAFKQLASFVTASTQIDAKLMARASKTAFSPAVDKRMMEHSDEIWTRYQASRIRLVGQFVDPSSTMLDKNKLSEKMMGMISFMDKAVIRTIWRASELEVSENTDLAFGTAEYFAAVNKRANQVIDRTQPAFSVWDQAGISLEGRTNSIAKLAGAMFMSQRNQNYTMIRRAMRKGGKEAVRDLTLVTLVSASIIAAIDWARREAYGFNEDKTAGAKVLEGLMNVLESNLSTIYGTQAAIDLIQPVRQLVVGEPIRFRGRDNVISSSFARVGQGVQDLMVAVDRAGDTIKQGDKRGQSIAINKLLSAFENFSIGIGVLSGVPISTPVQVIKAFGRQVWSDDYSILFKERSRLRKLDKEGKLSDFQKEKLNVLEQTFTLTNVAQRAVEAGGIDKADADSYITDQMRGAIQAIEKLEKTVPGTTFSPKEEAKEDEQLARDFHKQHGDALFKFRIASKERTLAKREFESIRKEDRRAFMRLNPETMKLVRQANKFSRLNGALTKLRARLTSTKTTPSQRAQLNKRVARLLERATQ